MSPAGSRIDLQRAALKRESPPQKAALAADRCPRHQTLPVCSAQDAPAPARRSKLGRDGRSEPQKQAVGGASGGLAAPGIDLRLLQLFSFMIYWISIKC